MIKINSFKTTSFIEVQEVSNTSISQKTRNEVKIFFTNPSYREPRNTLILIEGTACLVHTNQLSPKINL